LVSRLSLAHLLEKLLLIAFFFGLFAVPAGLFVSEAAFKKQKTLCVSNSTKNIFFSSTQNKKARCVSSSRALLLLYKSISRSVN
jgi:hypothetical protein